MKSSITNRNEKTSEISRINLTHYGLNMALMKETNHYFLFKCCRIF